MSDKPNYIHQLSDQVLCKVFDYLELESVKNASCTCRRWNEIIFSDPYVDRFIFTVSIQKHSEPVITYREMEYALLNSTLIHPELLRKKRKLIRQSDLFNFMDLFRPKSWRENVLKRLVETITNSKRCYRNLTWNITEFMYWNFQRVWQVIHPKFTKHLVLFKISFINSSLLFKHETLAEAIPLMTNLKDLLILEETKERYGYERYQEYTLMFRSQTIETLSLDFGYTSSIEMPKLLSFEGALSTLHQPTDGAESFVFERMKHLTVTQKDRISTDPSVFHRMPNLESIIWIIRLGHSIFIAMCEKCTSLKELCLNNQLYIHNIDALQHLYKLKNLYRLELYDIWLDDGRGFCRIVLDFDFSKMINLTELDLGKMFVADSTLERLPKTITKYGLRLLSAYDQRQIEIITRNLTQLKELRLRYHLGPTAPSPEVLKSLPLLVNLEVLEFCRCHFTYPTFFQMDGTLHRLHTLRFKYCSFQDMHFPGRQQKFPVLDEPEFKECMNDAPCPVMYANDFFRN